MKSLLLQESPHLVISITIIFIILSFIQDPIKIFTIYLIIIAIMYYLYRNPIRPINKLDDKYIYSAADGRVQFIKETKNNYVISQFLTPLDVHVQYVPYSGSITKIVHQPGTFVKAYLENADDNEQLITGIKTKIGLIHIIQIAGMYFRKIVNFNNINDNVKLGQKLGMIKFGSRVDVYLPKNKVKILVKKNDYLYGAKTKIAEIL